MSKIWFTSDLHLNNKNVIKYCNRPYADQYEMNKALIENWNSKVAEDDTVYVLGDFIMGMADTIPGLFPMNREAGRTRTARAFNMENRYN